VIILNSLFDDEDKLTPFFSAKRAPSTPNRYSGSPDLDEFKEDNGEASERSDFESASAVSTEIANRWIPQPRSRAGYLAYVIFTGPDTGVFYNWSV
jgi:hypothetical protein